MALNAIIPEKKKVKFFGGIRGLKNKYE